MTTSIARLLFLRLAGILAQGFLLTAATILFVFGMLELFQALALIAIALAWVAILPASARLRATAEFADEKSSRASYFTTAGITLAQYTRLRSFRQRARARKTMALPRDRFDLTSAIVTTVVWASFLGFLSTVLAGG